MAQHGSFPASIVTKPDLARCGPCASILWYQGRAKADSYGRLLADADSLVFEVMRTWLSQGTYTREEVAAARDQLAEAGLWHCYQIDGQTYAEYVGWDDDHPARSSLKMRGRPQCPDDPARPDLSWFRRPHKPGKNAQQLPPSKPAEQPKPEPTEPSGSADMPPVSPSRVPPREEEHGNVRRIGPAPVADHTAPIRQTPAYREFEEICRGNGMEQWLSEIPFMQLYRAVTVVTGREWPVLIEVARESVLSASRTPGPKYGLKIIENLPSTVRTQRDAKAHFEQSRGGAPPGSPPAQFRAAVDVGDPPPEYDDDPIALRARQQTAALRASHAAV